LDEEEGLTLRSVPLSSVRDVLLSSGLGELRAVAGMGLALAPPNGPLIGLPFTSQRCPSTITRPAARQASNSDPTRTSHQWGYSA
jgi:hypothetical protein